METMFMQNFGGKTKSIMVFLKVAYSIHLRRLVRESNEEDISGGRVLCAQPCSLATGLTR